MGATTLLASQTAAAQSLDVIVTKDNLPYTFSCTPVLAGTEKATLQLKDNAGGYSDFYQDGILQELGATNMAVSIFGPAIFRIDKDITATATAVIGQSHGNI
tara:strand:+ start:403 stop:708 length:306 start_codon:yes stop_codon:yes gene_type:complete